MPAATPARPYDHHLLRLRVTELARPMDFIGYTFSEVRQSLVDMEKMVKVLAIDTSAMISTPTPRGTGTPLEDRGPPAPVLPLSPPEVRFSGVCFTYPNATRPALVDASFIAPAGGVTALVGVSGSGKSTCLRLVSRLCEADAGSISLWGKSVREWPLMALRERLASISQQPLLFDDTLLWNLRLGAPHASERAVEDAAASALLTPCVRQMPHGLQSRIGERGSRLSGGERQRVSFARALLRDAPLLLADEPTSAADALTESALVEAMRDGTRRGDKHVASRTLLAVVHRLASVTPVADHIVVFHEGHVVEQGTHTTLLAHDGEYRRLWMAQEKLPSL